MASRPPEKPAPNDAAARNRWMVITMLRLFGFVVAVLGLVMSQGAVDLAGDSNTIVGYAFIVVGLLDGFVVPQLLARKWRSPPE
jgi:hypothetical protein